METKRTIFQFVEKLKEINVNEVIEKSKNITIEDDKYLLGWSCKLWNKEGDIDNFIENIKELHKCISIYEAYIEYTKFCSNSLIVSKRYFEKYIGENYHEYIDDEDDLKFNN